MKTKIYFIAIFLFAGIYTVQVQAQTWEYVCGLAGEKLCKVSTQGADTVYVVGENGLIAKSTDKGLTWDKQYFSNREILNDIVFYNHEIGFIAGNSGTILRTLNAGLSWEQIASGTDQNLTAIAVFDLNNIWVVGNNSIVMHSTDTGATWTIKPLLSASRYLSDIKCKGNRGFITGQGGVVLNTEDGGTTWEEQIPFESLTEQDQIFSLCITENKVFALVNSLYVDHSGDIVFTENDLNWHILSSTPNAYKVAVYFQDDQTGFVASYANTTCGDCGMGLWIYKTIDGGNTWEQIDANFFRNTWEQINANFFRNGNSRQSNFSFSPNNEFGYCLLINYLVRTPYTGEFSNCSPFDGMDVIKTENPVLILKRQENELLINSQPKIMSKVEIISTTGSKTGQDHIQTKEASINISNLPKGIYLINALFTDKTGETIKWIKQ